MLALGEVQGVISLRPHHERQAVELREKLLLDDFFRRAVYPSTPPRRYRRGRKAKGFVRDVV